MIYSRRYRTFLLSILFFGLCALHTGTARAVSGNVSFDSPVYTYLEILNSFALLPTYLAGTRPITWSEAYRLMEEARTEIGDGEGRMSSKTSLRAFDGLERAVFSRFGGDTGQFSAGILKAAALELNYLDGEPSSIPGINASQPPLIYNNEGIDPDEYWTASVSMELEESTGPVALQIFPRVTTGDESQQLIHRGVFKFGSDRFEISLGKESLWWGQGRHGGLYLTSNAQPLAMFRLTNPSAIELPLIFSKLGPFRYDFFLSRLEEDRAVPEPYFSGIRLNFRPIKRFELGLTMMIMTGGKGRPDVSFADLFDILFGENEIGGEDRTNKIAGMDFRCNLDGYQIYGELGGEDEAGNLPSKDALLLGVYIPDFTSTMDLRIEYVDFALTEEIAGAWYVHGAYTDGYTYNGRILGHHVGGDGRDLFGELTFTMGDKGTGKVGIDLEQRGVHLQPVVEEHMQISVGWERRFDSDSRDWTVQLGASINRVGNKDYIYGETETNGYLDFKVGWEI